MIENCKNKKAFTLIELLIVIAIIGILAGVVLVNTSSARNKALDARKIAEMNQVSKALNYYHINHGTMPLFVTTGGGASETNQRFIDTMQVLVSEGLLPVIPKSPDSNPYRYYDYGKNNALGAMFVTTLKAVPDTTTGIAPSCRPWGVGLNWCDQNNDKEYCLCNSYN